jgi:7,8-dihydroneopterin aldolase/epimerase/oxygenase
VKPALTVPGPIPLVPCPAPGKAGNRAVFVNDLVLLARIGVHDHELQKQQRIRVSVTLTVPEAAIPIADNLKNVVCYDEIVKSIRSIVNSRHFQLAETLAEEIASVCLVDVRVSAAGVQVEKLDVYADAGSVGISILRSR